MKSLQIKYEEELEKKYQEYQNLCPDEPEDLEEDGRNDLEEEYRNDLKVPRLETSAELDAFLNSVAEQLESQEGPIYYKYSRLEIVSKLQPSAVAEMYGKGCRVYQVQDKTVGSEMRNLVLKDLWISTSELKKGDIVHAIDYDYDDHTQSYVLQRLKGFLVIDPYFLISVTNLLGQLWCPRSSVFTERIPLSFDNLLTLRGVLAHEMLYKAVTNSLTSEEAIISYSEQITKDHNFMQTAYGLELSDKIVSGLVAELAKSIVNFMRTRYMSSNATTDQFSIEDIEVNCCNPTFGLKAKFDALCRQTTSSTNHKLIPFELKTGNSKFTGKNKVREQHVGQAQLYAFLSFISNYPSLNPADSSAILYYLTEDFLMNVPTKIGEIQQLINLRNKLICNSRYDDGILTNLPRPDGIEYDRKCTNCKYQTVCAINIEDQCTDAAKENLYGVEKELMSTVLNHLKPEEKAFFKKWMKFISFEVEHAEKSLKKEAQFHLSPLERQENGTCIPNLMIHDEERITEGVKSHILLILKSNMGGKLPDTHLQFERRELVSLSTDREYCVAYASVDVIFEDFISITLDRPLPHSLGKASLTLHIDKVPLSLGINLQYTFLLKMMEDSTEMARVRSTIIKRKPPTFENQSVEFIKKLNPLSKILNKSQLTSIVKSLTTDSYLMIQGMPGTGKTETIVRLVEHLLKEDLRILVVAYTNHALENILLRLKSITQSVLRLGRTTQKNFEELNMFSASYIAENSKSLNDLTASWDSKKVVASTLLSLKHPVLRKNSFDYCILDEASQASPAAAFGAVCLAKRFICFGDPEQLPSLIHSQGAKEMKLGDNFFSLMSHPAGTVKLTEQYRMHETIMSLSNSLVYDGCMTCATKSSELVLDPLLKETALEHKTEKSKLLNRLFFHDLNPAVTFCHVEGCEEKIGRSSKNDKEVELILCVISFLLQDPDICSQDIGVMAPYRGQVKAIRNKLERADERFSSIMVNTVDQFQGKEMEIVLCSFTRSKKADEGSNNFDPSLETSILSDMRRLNVAMTRAKKKLIMFGNRVVLRQYDPFRRLLNFLDNNDMVYSYA